MKDIRTVCIENLHHYWQALAKAYQGRLVESPTILASFTHINAAVFNPIFRYQISDDNYDEVKANLRTITATNALPICWWCPQDLQFESARKIFEKKSLPNFGCVPLMVKTFDAKESHTSLPPNLQLQEVFGDELFTWRDVVRLALGFEDDVAQCYLQALINMGDKVRHFCVKDGEAVVGTGSIFLQSEIVGAYNLGVLPTSRNQGIATAIHHARFVAAQQMGYRHITLQATPHAVELDTFLGFQILFNYDVFLDSLEKN